MIHNFRDSVDDWYQLSYSSVPHGIAEVTHGLSSAGSLAGSETSKMASPPPGPRAIEKFSPSALYSMAVDFQEGALQEDKPNCEFIYQASVVSFC